MDNPLDKPIACTCPRLIRAMTPLIERCSSRWPTATLVDLWLKGVPEPAYFPTEEEKVAYIRFTLGGHWDPRKDPVTKHWIFPSILSEWMVETSRLAGMELSAEQALRIANGIPDTGIALLI